MQNLPSIPIDWSNVNWLYVVVLAMFVFFSTMIGTLLSFRRTFPGAVLSALLFAASFVFWTYYPHGLPLPTTVNAQKATPAAPASPNGPGKPADPAVTISPPSASPPGNSQ